MSDDLKGAFVPIKDAQGNVTGIMDQATADYLASQAPVPTQASLDALLAEVTRVRVVPFSNFVQGTAEKTPFTEEQFLNLLALAKKGIGKLVDLQKMAVM